MKLHLNLSHGNNELIEYVMFMAAFEKVSFTKSSCNKTIFAMVLLVWVIPKVSRRSTLTWKDIVVYIFCLNSVDIQIQNMKY